MTPFRHATEEMIREFVILGHMLSCPPLCQRVQRITLTPNHNPNSNSANPKTNPKPNPTNPTDLLTLYPNSSNPI